MIHLIRILKCSVHILNYIVMIKMQVRCKIYQSHFLLSVFSFHKQLRNALLAYYNISLPICQQFFNQSYLIHLPQSFLSPSLSLLHIPNQICYNIFSILTKNKYFSLFYMCKMHDIFSYNYINSLQMHNTKYKNK